MTAYLVVNGTEAQLSNIDGAGTNVDQLSWKENIVLTDAQVVATLALGRPIAVLQTISDLPRQYVSILRYVSWDNESA